MLLTPAYGKIFVFVFGPIFVQLQSNMTSHIAPPVMNAI